MALEYQIVHFDADVDITVIETELNEWGAGDWRVVGQSQNTRGSIIYTLMRERQIEVHLDIG